MAKGPQEGKPTASRKRKAEPSLDDIIAAYKQNLNDKIDPNSFDNIALPTCTSIRGRINRLLDSGVMTKKDFCDAIDCSPNSLNTFLAKTGTMGGSGSSVWYNAFAWFKQRELAGLKLPTAQKRQKLAAQAEAERGASGAGAGAKGSNGKTASKKGVAATGAAALPDISQIHLEGEETDEVPVWDTCDEVRRKISAHFKATGVSQAQFCRDIYAQLHAPKCAGIQSKQLADFRGLKGPRGGISGSVFYSSYVYFEKLRIASGKPKSKHRETMETIYARDGGFDLDHDHKTR